MPGDPSMGERPDPPSSGWRWSDDILWYRIKFVGWMTAIMVVALAGYLLLKR